MLHSAIVSSTRSVDDRISKTLLAFGVVAGPLFVATSVVEAFARPGFDITRHPPSLLSLGDLGWIQIANFVVSGLLFIAGAIRMRRASASAWGSGLIVVLGISMALGGIFVVDAGLGFPAGAPAGQPSTMSWDAAVHLTGFGIGFASLVAACAVFARSYWVASRRGWSIYTTTVGIVAGACFVVFMSRLSKGNLLPLWLAVVVGWTGASPTVLRAASPQRAG